MSYGIDLSGHVGYTGSFDVPVGLNLELHFYEQLMRERNDDE